MLIFATAIRAVPAGMNRQVRKIVQAKIPDFSSVEVDSNSLEVAFVVMVLIRSVTLFVFVIIQDIADTILGNTTSGYGSDRLARCNKYGGSSCMYPI